MIILYINTFVPVLPSAVRLHALCLSFCMLSRSVDILELSEQSDLLNFYYHTLKLYSSLCALGNNRVAHALCSHIDESQLLYAIENKHMPGNTEPYVYQLKLTHWQLPCVCHLLTACVAPCGFI